MTPWVLRLLVANAVIFFLQGAMSAELFNQLVLVPALLPVRPWTLVTYQFLHGGLWHLAFNMLALFFFGPRLEARLGGGRFLGLYLTSGIGGALLSFVTPMVGIIGASGAVFGVLLAFARYYPRERIYIWGILPIESRVLVIILAVFSLWAGFGGMQDNVAHFAHLGGFVGGWVFLRLQERYSAAERFRRKVEAAAMPAGTGGGRGVSLGGGLGNGADVRRWRDLDASRLHPLNREEYERILAKAEREGAGSLTFPERAFMERVVASSGA
jgi:membrane associated rhomboid family serine protease